MNKSLLIFYVPLIVQIILTIIWASNTNKNEKFLGGLNWSDKVFNWHPILMTLSFGILFFSAIVSNYINKNYFKKI